MTVAHKTAMIDAGGGFRAGYAVDEAIPAFLES